MLGWPVIGGVAGGVLAAVLCRLLRCARLIALAMTHSLYRQAAGEAEP